MLPNFIIIGAMKSGTTSLYHYINQHPEVCMSKIKETDFFIAEKNYSKGINWYKSLFCQSNSKKVKAVGEASPNYSKRHLFHGVPFRVYKLLPKVKLIYVVRDPLDRILSHYIHNYSHGRERRTLPEAIRGKENHYILTSKYFYQIEAYRKYFEDEDILIIDSRSLQKDTSQTLEKVFNFINVDPSFKSNIFHKRFNTVQSKRKRRSLFDQYADMLVQLLERNSFTSRLLHSEVFKPQSKLLIKKIKNLFPPSISDSKDFAVPEMTKKDEDLIISLLKKDLENFKVYSGIDFLTPYKIK